MNLKEKIAILSELKRDAERADCELLGYSNAEEVEDRLRKTVKTFKDEADDMFEIIQRQQEIIRIQAEGLETLKAPKELTEGLVGGWPCICCGQDVRKIDIYVREILDKTKELTEG